MDRRLALHDILIHIPGVKKVYFQPPENLQIEYPCIVYNRSRSRIFNADNIKYIGKQSYQLTVMDRDPDSHIREEVSRLPYTDHNQSFVKDSLNHDVFTIYF